MSQRLVQLNIADDPTLGGATPRLANIPLDGVPTLPSACLALITQSKEQSMTPEQEQQCADAIEAAGHIIRQREYMLRMDNKNTREGRYGLRESAD
jgi:hypothetical protein